MKTLTLEIEYCVQCPNCITEYDSLAESHTYRCDSLDIDLIENIAESGIHEDCELEDIE